MKRGFSHESTYNESKEWYTPRYIFNALGLTFDVDVCSPGLDVVPWVPAVRALTIDQDGLKTPWGGGLVWMNPPYGSDTPHWMAKLAAYSGGGIALVFARPDTNWFHDYATKATAICFLSSRVQFVPERFASRYAAGELDRAGRFVWPSEYVQELKAAGKSAPGPGAGSMLVAYGQRAFEALINSKLGSCFILVG